MSNLHPWVSLYEVLVLLTPIFTFSVLSSIVIYVVFEASLLMRNAPIPILQTPAIGVPQPADPPPEPTDGFGYLDGIGYLVMASLFGVVLGILVKLCGGFSVLNGASNALVGGIGAVLVIVLGVVGTIFSENGRIYLRKPIGAIAFLMSFLVSGFYWKLLENPT